MLVVNTSFGVAERLLIVSDKCLFAHFISFILATVTGLSRVCRLGVDSDLCSRHIQVLKVILDLDLFIY